MSAQQSIFTTDEVALSWANQNFPNEMQHLVADHPWSKVFRLQGQTEAAYLKLVPAHEKKVLDKTALINKYFPNFTPKLKASDLNLGALIEESVSIPLGEFTSQHQQLNLLATYADIQSKATEYHEILTGLPNIDIKKLFNEFLNFLNPEYEYEGGVGADYFMDDPREAKGYFMALSDRRSLIEDFLSQSEVLPKTLNHCDLHTDNVSETNNGTMVIFDWDDAVIGPAGMSLYRLFNGCSHIPKLINPQDELEVGQEHYRKLLNHYIDRLIENDYADLQALRKGMPAAVCAGSVLSMLSYAKFPEDDFDYKRNVSEIIRNRLEDLVHLCDLMALEKRQDTFFYADNYYKNGAPWRGIHLLEQYSLLHPNDIEVLRLLAFIQMDTSLWEGAVNTLQRLVSISPYDALARQDLGISMVKSGKPELAISELEKSLSIDPTVPQAEEYINKASQLIFWTDRARIPHLAPTIELDVEETENNTLAYEKSNLAISFFKEYGNLVVKNAFPRELIEEIAQVVNSKYDSYFKKSEYDDCLLLGDKRHMITLDIEGVLNTPRMYGSQVLVDMMSTLLDTDYVLASYNATVSLPGAKDQGLHKDYTPLFKSDDPETHVTPPFAIAALIPLLDMTPELGVTAMRKGTHLVPEQMPFDYPVQEPVLQMGDALIFDYRTAHEGLANRTDRPRPFICLVFHRIWFRDALNYNQQKDVSISAEELKKVPEELKHLFHWV